MQRSDSLVERMDPVAIDRDDPEIVELAEVGKDRFRFASLFSAGKTPESDTDSAKFSLSITPVSSATRRRAPS